MLTAEIQNLIMIGVVAIAALIIGVIIGNMAGRRGSKSPNNKKAAAEIKKEGYAEIAALWYSSAAKHIISEINGEFYKDFSTLPLDLQKKALRLSELFTDWVHTVAPPEEKPVEVPVAAAEESAPEEPAPEEPVPAFSTVEETKPQMNYERPGATKPLPFVETEPVDNEIPPVPPVVFTRLEPQAEEPVKAEELIEPFNPLTPEDHISPPAGLKSKTVAGQISDIIAEMIQDSPLKQKGVKLIERPDHGVDVWVGVEKFDGVGSIPYPEVKELIREAATRWERENSDK